MRTTVTIDDDILAAARAIASDRGISVGATLSDLARRALRQPVRLSDDDLPTFSVPEDAEPLTPEQVWRALDDT